MNRFPRVVAVAAIVLSLQAQAPAPRRVTGADFEQMMKELSNWGRWGKTDQMGSMNLITPAKRKSAAGLVKEGFAESLTEAATRFAITNRSIGTILVGIATPQEFDGALAAVEKGPLPKAALERLAELQKGFAGEKR